MDTFGGKVEVRWNSDAEVTAMGQMAFFIEFLKTAGLWRSWVEDSPLMGDNYRPALTTTTLESTGGGWRSPMF